MDHLPENVVKDEEFAPAVLQQLHLVVHLVRQKHFKYFETSRLPETVQTSRPQWCFLKSWSVLSWNINNKKKYIDKIRFLLILPLLLLLLLLLLRLRVLLLSLLLALLLLLVIIIITIAIVAIITILHKVLLVCLFFCAKLKLSI